MYDITRERERGIEFMSDVVVVGAGVAGCVMAERFASRGCSVLMLERRRHVAGNCYDRVDDSGILVGMYGPHIFHTDDARLWEYLSRFTSWRPYHHEVRAFVDGRLVQLPFSLESLYQLFPASLAKNFEAILLDSYGYGAKVPILELRHSALKELRALADIIYDKIFLHYTIKQWGLPPDKLDDEVTARLPILIGHDSRYFQDRFQAVPKRGYSELFTNMLNHKNIKIMLNTDFHDVMKLNDGEIFLFGQRFCGQLIYTGQLDELFGKKFGELPYRSMKMKFETVDAEFFQDVPVVNYPNDYDFLRITEFKRINPGSFRSPRTTLLYEYPQDYTAGKNEPCYPLFTDEARTLYEKYCGELSRFDNIALVGRLAEYRYYDIDDAVMSALKTFERLTS